MHLWGLLLHRVKTWFYVIMKIYVFLFFFGTQEHKNKIG